MACNNCLEISSSKCVEFDANYNVYEKLIYLANKVKENEDKLSNKVDSKTLGVGNDLVATVQKLVDLQLNTNNINASNKVFTYDVSSISEIVERINQEDLNLLLINKIYRLEQDIQKLITYNNNYNV